LAFVHGYWLSVALPLATSVPLFVGYSGARLLVERHTGKRIAAEKAMLGRFQSPLSSTTFSGSRNFWKSRSDRTSR
jgi:hypothetical protein